MIKDVVRDLDVQVIKAMGWELIPDPTYHGLGGAMFAVLPTGERRFMWHLKEHVYSGEEPWTPSTDIAAAWEVVEHARRQNLVLKLYQTVPGDLWDATFYVHASVRQTPEPVGCWARASTAPEAICKAFVKAIGEGLGGSNK